MALNLPVPEGGTADYLAVLSDDAHELTDRKLLEASDTWDPGSLAAGTQESKDFTVAGAALGDFAIAGAGLGYSHGDSRKITPERQRASTSDDL